MPSWAKDKDKWKRAVEIVKKQHDKNKSDFVDRDWGLVTHIYKNMDGEIKSKSESLPRALSIVEQIRSLF
jgi:hypothetical protein